MPAFGWNGILEICISRESLLWPIIESILETRLALVTWTSFLYLPINLIRHLGLSLSKSGAHYLSPVRSTDGFKMPLLSPYNGLEMGPRQRCLRGAEEEAEKRNIHTYVLTGQNTVSFSHGKEFTSDISQESQKQSLLPAEPGPGSFWSDFKPYQARILGRLAVANELVRDYQPRNLYFDWWIQRRRFPSYLMRFWLIITI